MPNFKLVIEYKGTNYAGWQRQKNQKSIQGEIEKALKKIFGQDLKLIGAGRTDAGVHALGQVANFSVETKLSKDEVREALNFYLPKDIRIKRIGYAHSSFHSRFSAKGKVYRYLIIQDYSPFLEAQAYFYPRKLNLARMKKATKYLLGKHNFTSLVNRGSNPRSAKIELNKIEIKTGYLNPGKRLTTIIDVEAKAFLYRLVRNLIGLLLEVGRGKIRPREVKLILQARERQKSPWAVPASGLYLLRVKY